MKNKFTAVILCIVFAVLTLAPCATADNDIRVVLNGVELTFDVPPVIMSGRTMVPMRVVFEALGYKVTWDEKNRSINAKRGSDEINMYIDFYTMWTNGNAVQTDVAPCITDGRTLVPLRAVSEMSGCLVDWNENERSVYIDTRKAPETTPIPAETTAPDPNATPAPSPTPKGIELDVHELTINEGKTYNFSPAIKTYLADKKVVWESSDWTVCSITSKGKLSADSDGTCTITAKVGGQYDTCEVTVKNVPKDPILEVMGFDTTKLFTKNREYVLITLRNYGDCPVEIDETAEYTYITDPEGVTGVVKTDFTYDTYTMKLKADKTVIDPKSYATITFTRDGEPKIGSKVKQDNFEEFLCFKLTYDGKKHTAYKYKKTSKKTDDGKEKQDFVLK